jgi:hypothetical protein
MKIKCPDCGSTIDIDRLREERAFREIVALYKRLPPPEASLVGEYLDCFRASAHADMSPKKHLRILKEVVRLIDDGVFHYARRTYHLDRGIALEAMERTVNTEKRAFSNHNYWKAIMIGLLKKRDAVSERAAEDKKLLDAERRSAQIDGDPSGRPDLPARGVSMPEWVKERLKL